jgi:Restriction endonuclease|nr:MAG TPA: HNH endonuclease [Caudoviricetes sp.]
MGEKFTLLKKLCREAGCNEFALERSCYCEKHNREIIPFQKAKRSNENLYQTSTWRALRKAHIQQQQPCCVRCGTNESLTVDHIIPPRGSEALFFDVDNLQTLCRECHRVKTAQEIRARLK